LGTWVAKQTRAVRPCPGQRPGQRKASANLCQGCVAPDMSTRLRRTAGATRTCPPVHSDQFRQARTLCVNPRWRCLKTDLLWMRPLDQRCPIFVKGIKVVLLPEPCIWRSHSAADGVGTKDNILSSSTGAGGLLVGFTGGLIGRGCATFCPTKLPQGLPVWFQGGTSGGAKFASTTMYLVVSIVVIHRALAMMNYIKMVVPK
jgi:hypothetical protein